MKFLLDTHALLWAVSDPKKLSDEAGECIAESSHVICVSLVSLWELRIKESIGKITLPKNFYKSLTPAGFEMLPINLAHIETYGHLPPHHRDPFDRMLVAQAKVEQLTLVTRDEEIEKYGVNLLKA